MYFSKLYRTINFLFYFINSCLFVLILTTKTSLSSNSAATGFSQSNLLTSEPSNQEFQNCNSERLSQFNTNTISFSHSVTVQKSCADSSANTQNLYFYIVQPHETLEDFTTFIVDTSAPVKIKLLSSDWNTANDQPHSDILTEKEEISILTNDGTVVQSANANSSEVLMINSDQEIRYTIALRNNSDIPLSPGQYSKDVSLICESQ